MDRNELKALSNDRNRAESLLRQRFHLPCFYDEQWEAIRRLIVGERILMIEKTGFGKSLCYQFPATLFDGVTIVFTPLIALMRDQVNSLKANGIAADCINSEKSDDENGAAIASAQLGRLKILYIAPERQENSAWQDAIVGNTIRISMIVIDEAHTISVWGHDFRPAFRRIVNLVQILPEGSPLLATTATATMRVQEDIESQIGHGVSVIRGDLMRENFRLHVIVVSSEEEKMVWLAKNFDKFSGTGLIYTGTRVMTDTYSRWLRYNEIDAVEYNAGLDAASRMEIEAGLMSNRWKCVVSTNALGMGIDKPDIRFIIHTQLPASPIHYYQEIGRAGRDGKETQILLFYNSSVQEDGLPTDLHLPKAFIDGAKPSADKYRTVIDALKQEPMSERDIISKTNMRTGQVRTIKADLLDQGIIRESVDGRRRYYEYQYNAPELDVSSFEALREAKMADLQRMVDYVFCEGPRMKYLCEYLGDTAMSSCSGCDNTSEEKWTAEMDDFWERRIREFRESYFPEIKCSEKRRRNNMVDGVAASYYGVSEVGGAIHRSKYENGGDFPPFLLRLTLKAYRKTFGNRHLDYVMCVPPTVSGSLVENFARKVARTLGVPFSDAVVKTRVTKMQKKFCNSYGKQDNVKDAFAIGGTDVTGKDILLVDDIYDTGATLKEIGRVLTAAGARSIIPLVIAKTVASDDA